MTEVIWYSPKEGLERLAKLTDPPSRLYVHWFTPSASLGGLSGRASGWWVVQGTVYLNPLLIDSLEFVSGPFETKEAARVAYLVLTATA